MLGPGPRSGTGVEDTVLAKARMAKVVWCLKSRSMVVRSQEVLDLRGIIKMGSGWENAEFMGVAILKKNFRDALRLWILR